MRDVVERGLRAAARQRFRRRGVEAIFQHVEVKRPEIFRAVHLQFGHHGVEFVDAKVAAFKHLFLRVPAAQNVLLQFGGAAQGVAVDFQQLVGGNGVGGGVEVAHIGQQEAQGVADAAVSVDHAGQDFVVNVQVARIVGGGHPQAHNFCAELVGDFLRNHHIA